MSELSRLTRAIRAGIDTDPTFGAVVPPVVLSTTFSFTGFDEPRTYDYTRCSNPTRDTLAEALSTLEEGAGAVVTATGMGAMTLVLNAYLQPGDTLLIPHDCYGGSWRLFDALQNKGHFRVVAVDFTDEAATEAAFAANPDVRMVWLETPSNPLLRITDLAAVSTRAHAAGALVVADNTFLSPVLQQPLTLGVDIVLHSSTKYINGHSDVVGGAVVAKTAEMAEHLAWWANVIGITGSPFDSYLTVRGLRTLPARMRLHNDNAMAVATTAAGHAAVATTYYPGLPDHAGHDLAARQQDGFGGMVTLKLRGGLPAVRAFLTGLACFTLAESLGGVESLVAHPPTMTHASMTPQARELAGVTDDLLRLSVGIEQTEDLVNDLKAALDRAAVAADD